MKALPLLCLFLPPLLARAQGPVPTAVARLLQRDQTIEWTAFGDSYASGVGAGDYIDGRRCLRYDDNYGRYLNEDPGDLLPGGNLSGRFHSVVCSGSNAEQVMNFQLYEEDQDEGQPNNQYFPRPSAGKPSVATLTVGGNDVDFPGILNNCIVGHFPFPLNLGFTSRSCDDQRDLSWNLISAGDHNTPNQDLVNIIDSTIEMIADYAMKTTGKDPWIYVTGYGQFFNAETTACNDVTFRAPGGGVDPPKLSQELRRDLNQMSLVLNKAVQQAISQAGRNQVRYIDIDGLAEGHRFCEPGVQEPDQNNTNLYFFHYPYDGNEPNGTEQALEYLNQVAQNNSASLSYDPKTTTLSTYLDEFWSVVPDDFNAQFPDFWRDIAGYYAKLFHPQSDFHEEIYEAIAKQYSKDQPVSGTNPPSPPPPKPSGIGINCNGSTSCDSSDNAMGNIQSAMQGAIDEGHGNQVFKTGDHIACDCRKDKTGICAFFQLNNASGTVSTASDLVKQLQEGPKCVNCGSAPTSGQDISVGELTVNYVVDSQGCCNGTAGSTYCGDSNPRHGNDPDPPVCVPTGDPKVGPTGPGKWGLEFVNDCNDDASQDVYAGKGEDNFPCSNLVAEKPWDSIIVTRQGGMQIQLFANEDCDPCGGCLVFNSDFGGHVDSPRSCFTSIGDHNGIGFAKSFRTYLNGTAPGECEAH